MTTSPDQNYTSWHVGMKVVCVDNGGAGSLLAVGEVYTIRSLEPRFVTLAEDSTWSEINGADSGWYYSRFRPVQTRQTDISVFTAMLSPKPAKAGKVRA